MLNSHSFLKVNKFKKFKYTNIFNDQIIDKIFTLDNVLVGG